MLYDMVYYMECSLVPCDIISTYYIMILFCNIILYITLYMILYIIYHDVVLLYNIIILYYNVYYNGILSIILHISLLSYE